MASDNDSSGDAPPPGWSASKAKRPHAVLDLEAIDVTPPRPAAADAAAPVAGEPANAEAEAEPFSGAATDEADAAPSGSSGSAAPDGSQTRSPPSRNARWTAPLAAGAAGGALTVALYATLAPLVADLSGARAPSPESLNMVERRLDTLEQAMPLPVSPQLGEKVAAAESRAAGIAEAQARLASDVKTLAETVGAHDFAALEGRLAKIESQFATLAESGQGNPDAGPIPQLAAVTAKLASVEARGSEAKEAARAAAESVEAVKKDMARLDQAIATIKAETARAAEDAAAALRGRVDALAAGIDKQLQTAAKSGDIAAAIAPVSGKLAALEQSVAAVAASEESRRAAAERILLTLELAGLKRAVERGEPYARELAEVRAASAGKWDLSAFERSSERGVPARASLEREFHDVSRAVLDAANEPQEGSIFGRLVAGAKSVVRVRKVDYAADDASVEAVTDRMAKALETGRLDSVIAEAGRLPPRARAAARGWLDKVEARHAIDGAIATIENQLRVSLTN